MANLSQFQRGSTTYDLKALALKYIVGTGTAAKTSSSPYCFSKWEADAPEITSLYNGLTILYKVPVAGNGKYGTCLQLNSLGYHPVVVQTNGHVSTRYGVGAMIMLVYNEGLSCSVYGTTAGANATEPASITGVWVVVNDYNSDTDTRLRTYASTSAVELPLVAVSTAATATTTDYTSGYKDSYGQIPSTVANRATINLNTGEVKAKLFSGEFNGLATQASQDGAGNNIIDTYAKKSDLNSLIAATDAMTFKGTLGTGGTITAVPASHTVGDTYKVITASTWAGQKCEVGDLLICITTSTAANNAHWTVAQTNIDGAVTGPTSATTSNFAAFNGTSGKTIQDSGYGPNDFSLSGHKHPFSDITDTPTTLSGYGITATAADIGAAASSHAHGNITSDGKVGTASNKALYTGTSGTVTSGTLPVAAGGTGATSFTANSLIMSGSGTTSALTTRAITNNTSNAATTTGTSIPTMSTIYYGQVLVNGVGQTRGTNIHVPTGNAPGANAILYATGTASTSTVSYKATANGALYTTTTNGALTFGTLPIAQGGTGATTASAALAALGGSSGITIRM